MGQLEYGFRQAIRDELIGLVNQQKPLFDALACAIERRMGDIIADEIRRHFLRRMDVLEQSERETYLQALRQCIAALDTLAPGLDEDNRTYFRSAYSAIAGVYEKMLAASRATEESRTAAEGSKNP